MVDYVKHWSQRTELAKTRLIGWLGLGTSKFYQWQERYGQANEHNGRVPRDYWLEEWRSGPFWTSTTAIRWKGTGGWRS